ncbi:hypothetical protein CANMA_002353 [Candida margitis]|uniref:uncharacterized protein n=1 Tax=Candida margitis TaxID=1775924 RepID=UPI00222640D2|nr:uncharacterized protein CANMA_002353 [Candida margitis]KAI5968608.1 hypothetical protein CANMA_002353 [Candida margitis]
MSTTELYGGAITINKLPSSFIDISRIRQVPDSQEVFINEVDSTNPTLSSLLTYDQALIFDLLERVDADDYESAIAQHLQDFAPSNTANHPLQEVQIDGGDELLYFSYVSFKPEYERQEHNQAKQIVILICLLRLDKVGTDVLIQYNLPLKREHEGSINFAGGDNEIDKFASERFEWFKNLCASFKIADWKLFQ